MKRKLQIDREFATMSVPKSEEEQEAFEKSLLREGCLEPIVIWNDVILDGHKRYEFCSYEEIDFEVKEMDFPSREDAISWIARQHLKQAEPLSIMYRYLIGKLYNSHKVLFKRERKKGPEEQNADMFKFDRIASYLGAELGLTHTTLTKYGSIVNALESIDEKEPALFKAILNGDVTYSRATMVNMGKMSAKELLEIRRKITNLEDPKMRKRAKASKKEQPNEYAEPLAIGIKDMPAFDPDMELKGLILTVPTWMNAVARAQRKTDMDLASEKVKLQLAEILTKMEEQINITLEVLR